MENSRERKTVRITFSRSGVEDLSKTIAALSTDAWQKRRCIYQGRVKRKMMFCGKETIKNRVSFEWFLKFKNHADFS